MLSVEEAYMIMGFLVVVMYAYFSKPQKEDLHLKKEVKRNDLSYRIWMDYKEQIKECNTLEELGEVQDSIDLHYYSSSVDDITAQPFYNSLGLEITIRNRQLKESRFS